MSVKRQKKKVRKNPYKSLVKVKSSFAAVQLQEGVKELRLVQTAQSTHWADNTKITQLKLLAKFCLKVSKMHGGYKLGCLPF